MEKYQKRQFLPNINQIFQQHHVPYTMCLDLNLESNRIPCMLIMNDQYDSLDLNMYILWDLLINNFVVIKLINQLSEMMLLCN